MTDTAQPETAAESVVASDPFIDAANAFKTFDPEATESTSRPRDEQGRFASKEPIEAEDEAEPLGEAEDAAESQDDEETDEAADEAQPEAVDLPPSWPAELAEEWQSLPAPLQDKIVQREAEREAAVNAKFQEAANVRKANEALITEANANRQKFAEAADVVLSTLQPQAPSKTMLDQRSADYNPDAYHYLKAEYDETVNWLSNLQQQRQGIAAQQQQEERTAEMQYVAQVEEKYRPVLLKDVPDLADPAKQGPVLHKLIQYATSQGIGEHVFTDPEIAARITSPELHMAWKAMKYDEMMSAKAKVTPKAPKPAAPPVRPGVATSRSAVEASTKKKLFERLDRSGSIEDAAAIFKMQSKGNFR